MLHAMMQHKWLSIGAELEEDRFEGLETEIWMTRKIYLTDALCFEMLYF